jgi:alpha-beta hydrolase superfamily lysophospholipase
MEKDFMLLDPYENELFVQMWIPENKPKAVVQIIHGAGEHIGRYDHFAKYLVSLDYVVIGNDHLGHGKTATEKEYVYFGSNMGFHKVYEGVRTVRDYIEEHYSGLPVIMFAHSMGSFIGRYAILYDHKRYIQAIFSGTGWFNSFSISAAKIMSKILIKVKGPLSLSSTFTRLTTDGAVRSMQKAGLINKRIEWLTHDRDIQRAFEEDEMCGKPFTLSAQSDVFHFMPEIQNRKRIRESASSTAIFFISGELDGLGNYGAAAKKLYNIYNTCGYSNVKYVVINNARHEVINELDRDSTYVMISDFIKRNL